MSPNLPQRLAYALQPKDEPKIRMLRASRREPRHRQTRRLVDTRLVSLVEGADVILTRGERDKVATRRCVRKVHHANVDFSADRPDVGPPGWSRLRSFWPGSMAAMIRVYTKAATAGIIVSARTRSMMMFRMLVIIIHHTDSIASVTSVISLRVLIAFIDEEERTPVEAKSFELKDDCGELLEFTDDDGDVIDEKLLAIAEKGSENLWEIRSFGGAALILVLRDEGSRAVIPNLRRNCNSACHTRRTRSPLTCIPHIRTPSVLLVLRSHFFR